MLMKLLSYLNFWGGKLMQKVVMSLNEIEMSELIKNLLCLHHDGRWIHTTMTQQLELKFKGNRHNVQKSIYNWLSLPERKHNFELLGD